MRILHVNDVANVGTTLAAAQRRRGHHVDVRRLRLVAADRSTALKALSLPLRVAEWRRINREIASGHYDVVHIHYAYLGLLGVLGRYPYVIHCHGTDVRSGLKDPIRRPAVRLSLRRAAAVLVATPDLLELVREVRPDAVFVPDPVDTEWFRPGEPGPAGGPPAVLIHAALSRLKRSDIAFAAVRILLGRMPDLRVSAVDHGPDRGLFGGVPGVSYVPPVPHAATRDLILAHDLVLGQFGIGSLGMAELEAMACARPLICHFTQAAAYPAPPPIESIHEPEAVAEAAERLLRDQGASRLQGEAGREWVARYHGAGRVAEDLDGVYRAAGLGREGAGLKRTPS